MIGISVARFFIIFFNILLCAFGVVCLVFGVTVYLNNYTLIDKTDTYYAEALHVIYIPDVIGYAAIFMMTAGAVSMFFSIFGCCAVSMFGRHALLMYWIVILLLALFHVAVIIYILSYPEEKKEEIKQMTYDSLTQHFKPVSQMSNVTWKDLENFGSEDSIQVYWLMMEMRFNCCGANDFLDYQTFLWDNITHISDKSVYASVPIQCCKDLRTGNLTSPTVITKCLEAEPTYINTEGCSDTVLSAVRVFGIYAAGLVAIAIGIQVILLAAAIYLWTKFHG